MAKRFRKLSKRPVLIFLLKIITICIVAGIFVLSPSSVSAANLTLRPNGAGDYTALSPIPGIGEANWQDVDEAATDDSATYVRTNSSSQVKDAYALDADKKFTNNVSTQITENLLIITLDDPEWLNDSQRQFPIIIYNALELIPDKRGEYAPEPSAEGKTEQ